MNLYKQTAVVKDGRIVTQWAGSQGDASKQRSAWTKEGVKRVDITTEIVDVPTNKAGLIEFLNGGA